MRRMTSSVTGLVAMGLMVLTAAPAFAADGNLPGGTSISVDIDSPVDGAVVPPGPVTVTGTATIGEGVPVAATGLTYVLDASASTFHTGIGCGGDQNADGVADRVMDCEIAAAKQLNETAVSLGTVGDVGAVAFGSTAVTADVQPAVDEQLVTGPGSDLDGVGGRDIEEVLSSTISTNGDGSLGEFSLKTFGGNTNFEDAVLKATEVAAASAMPRRIVAFLSDGVATEGGSVAEELAAVPDEVDFFTFAVGGGSSCANTGSNNQGSLDQIATATGGICTPVPDVASLPDVLPGVIASQLTSLTLSVDGLPPAPITDITPDLPQDGPASVDYTVQTGPLAPGTHELCVTANGTDGGGAGSVTECATVVVFLPAEAFAVQASGLVTVPKTPLATCPPGEDETLAQLNLVLGVVNGLNASCAFDPGTGETTAEASVLGASLLGGAITVSTIESTCVGGPDGSSGTSKVGTINGIPIGTGSGSLSILGVATVFYNETVTGPNGSLVQNAVRVRTLLGQEIILAGCRLG